ncbi:hypothetical protein V6O07_02195 [Arthrospira platensis SPKY2]
MFFPINDTKKINTKDYIGKKNSYELIFDILENEKYIKDTLKSFLKQNKYIKYYDNGDEFIELSPNNKFFKKFKTDEDSMEYVKQVFKEYLDEIEFDHSEVVVKLMDIYLKNNNDKQIITIIF